MTARSTRRRGRGVVLAASGAAAWLGCGVYLLAFHTTTAGAITQPAREVKSGATQSDTYLPIAGQNPALVLLGDPTPDECQTAVYCDTIPYSVDLPAGFNTHDFYMSTKVSVSWTSQRLDNPAQPAQQNDIDIYVYAAQKDADGNWVEVGHSASSNNPEIVTTEQPNFILVVNNYSGVNTGYTVQTKNVLEHFTKPFELLGPTFRPTDSSGDTVAPTEPSVAPIEPAAPAPTGDGGFTPIAPGAAAGGPPRSINLVDSKGATNVDDVSGRQLLAASSLRRAATESKRPNTLLVVVWLAVLPLSLLGGLGMWLRRRSPAAIRI